MKNLYIDFDGVIIDTIEYSYKKLAELNLDIKNPNDGKKIGEYYKSIDWKEFLRETPLINESMNSIKKILESNKFYVSILTHVNSLEEAIEKVHYIRQYFKDITVIPVPKAISKTKMVQTKDSILIDDYAGNLREWESEGGIAVRFSTKLNGKGFAVINKLDQILEIKLD